MPKQTPTPSNTQRANAKPQPKLKKATIPSPVEEPKAINVLVKDVSSNAEEVVHLEQSTDKNPALEENIENNIKEESINMNEGNTPINEFTAIPPMRAVQARNNGAILAQDKYECIYALAKQGFKAEDICDLTIDSIEIKDEIVTVTVEGKDDKGEPTIKSATLSYEESMRLAKFIKNNVDKIKLANKIIFFSKNPAVDGGKVKPNNVTTGLRDYLGKVYKIGLQDIGWAQISKAKSKNQSITDIKGFEELLGMFK